VVSTPAAINHRPTPDLNTAVAATDQWPCPPCKWFQNAALATKDPPVHQVHPVTLDPMAKTGATAKTDFRAKMVRR